MGLLPLEFTDCFLDSPYFRENLKAHEKQLEQTSVSIKALITGIQDVLESAKRLSQAKKNLAETLDNCQFDCLGSTLTDDEILIASSLKQFAKFLSAMEDEMNGILLQANEKFITPLLNFRKDQIGSVKQTKKAFEKATSKLCTAQDRYVAMSGKKEESLAEASDTVRHEQKQLNASSLEYVYLMHVVQERKKFEFVEAILNFTQSWVSYYRRGHTVACEQEEYMTDLKSRVSKTRDNFSANIGKYEELKEKMLSSPQDPGLMNRMYTRQGYLFVQGKKNLKLGSVWTKYFCQYQAKTKALTLIPYNQLAGKITSGDSLRVTGCVCHDDLTEKFRFTVTGEDLTEAKQGMVSHTVQALSEFERKNWVEALGGTWPAVNTLQRIRADSVEDNLNSCAFTFLKDCLSELESRGLVDQGLYRVGGVVSKVKKLLNQALDPAPGEESPDMSDPKQWESKTLASAIKQYFRDLSKPLMTYQLYNNFLESVKKEDESTRLNEIYLVLQKLPRANREILKVLIRHLNKVSLKSDKNLMTASNLGVVFGPTLLRPREETVASIMDIKFCNEVIEILIENCERFFPSMESSPEFLHTRRPSLETSGGSSQGEPPSPAVVTKCKRTQSFSSFSQLSTASLPDIKEFPRPTHLPHPDRPRSKSHQHDVAPPVVAQPRSSKESSPAPLHLSKAATQDDLMASLEMMNFLAADLPTSSPLKRSYTLNPKRLTRTPGTTREVTRKPPLPKLWTVGPVSPCETPTSCNSSQSNLAGLSLPPTPHQARGLNQFSRQNSAPSRHSRQTSPEPALLPRRPSDLPAKLISAFEGLCASPGQQRRLDDSLVIEEYGQTDSTSLSSSDPSQSPRAASEDRLSSQDFLHTVTSSSPVPLPQHRANLSLDSGVVTSPSPPTDSSIALLSPSSRPRNTPSNNEDCSSVISCSLSEASDTSGSKYDNVKLLEAGETDKTEQGEELDSSDSGDSEEGREDNRNTVRECLDNSRNHRDSGPYENVTQQTEILSNVYTKTGLHSLRKILTNGQTTNV